MHSPHSPAIGAGSRRAILLACLLAALTQLSAQQAATDPGDPATVRVVITERLLCRDRQWTTTDGSTVTGALLAHRPADHNRPAAAHPITVVKDNRIRLRIGWGTYTLPLDKFSDKDREFVRQLEKAIRQKVAGNKAATERPADGFEAPVTPRDDAP